MLPNLSFFLGVSLVLFSLNISQGQVLSKIEISEIDDIKVHTYINESLVSISTHILEFSDSLLIIDAQLTYTDTQELVKYAQSLQKPVSRVIITHAHPDHYLGIYAYSQYKIFALPEVIQSIQENGEKARQVFLSNFGSESAAPEVLVPRYRLPRGVFHVSNTELVVSVIKETEVDIAALIKIPAKKILIAGDLLYNQVHLFPGHNHLVSWRDKLKTLRIKSKYILPGHGPVGSKNMIRENIKYLNKAIEMANMPGMDVSQYKESMMALYPKYKSAILIDFGGKALFQE